jgi:enterochelin esterase-like enzyme
MFFFLLIVLIGCCTNNTPIDAEHSIIKQLENGTVYKISIKTNEYYYPHYLYLPHTTTKPELFPVLYICGAHTPNSIFFDIGFVTFLDNIIGENKTPPFALVAASCLDFYTDFEDTLFNKLIPYLENTFPITAAKNQKAISGISAGGSLALNMAYNHRNAFSILGLHSATLVGDDHDKVKELLEYYKPVDKFDLFIDVGQSDLLFEAHALLLPKIKSAPREFTFITPPGGHDSSYWQQQLPVYFKWYSSVLCHKLPL